MVTKIELENINAELNNQITDLNKTITRLNKDISDNNSEIETLNNSLSEQGSEIEKLQGTISTKDSEIETLNNSLSEQGSEIEKLQGTISTKDSEIETLNNNLSEQGSEIEKLQGTISTKDSEIETLNNNLSEKDEKIKSLSKELKQFEVRKFALSFQDEKNEYKKELDKWGPIALRSFILLLFVTIFITFISFKLSNIDKISLIFIESVTVLFSIFSVKQYLHYSSVYGDALRRQTLAQGYQHILEGEEDDNIKPEYREKLVGVLCDNEKKENKYLFPQEKLMEKIVDLSDSITKYLGKQ